MPKVSESYLKVRREQILDAAIACFARNGFHQTTMADIAHEAGITPGSIYRYFANKEDVIEASVQARQQARIERFRGIQQRGDPSQILDGLVDVYIERADRNDALAHLGVQLYGEALRNPRVRTMVHDIWNDALARVEEVVRLAQAQGEIDPALDSDSFALLLMAVVEGLIVHKSVDPDTDVWRCAEVLKALYSNKI